MVFMITTIDRQSPAARKRRGFTLSEVLIAATLTVVVVSGALSTTLMLARTGYTISQYTDMETESRKSMEQFGQDVRMAKAIVWNNATSVTLTVPTNSTGTTAEYTYTYDAVAQTFSRTTTAGTRVLLSGIESCTLVGYKLNGTETHDPASPPSSWTVVNNSTKQLQLSIASRRTQGGTLTTTQKVISARFILRNKAAAA